MISIFILLHMLEAFNVWSEFPTLYRRYEVYPSPIDPTNSISLHLLLGFWRVEAVRGSGQPLARDTHLEEHLPVDLIGGISSNHVHNSFGTSRMVFQPRINLQHLLVHDDNGSPISNQPLDLASRQYGFCPIWSHFRRHSESTKGDKK